jgi:hypothetical protein
MWLKNTPAVIEAAKRRTQGEEEVLGSTLQYGEQGPSTIIDILYTDALRIRLGLAKWLVDMK